MFYFSLKVFYLLIFFENCELTTIKTIKYIYKYSSLGVVSSHFFYLHAEFYLHILV